MSGRFREKRKLTKQLLGSQQKRPSRKQKKTGPTRDGRGNGGGASERLMREQAQKR